METVENEYIEVGEFLNGYPVRIVEYNGSFYVQVNIGRLKTVKLLWFNLNPYNSWHTMDLMWPSGRFNKKAIYNTLEDAIDTIKSLQQRESKNTTTYYYPKQS